MAGRVQPEIVHRLNAFTWAGRRAECAVTSEFLNTTGSSQTWEGVTCPECLMRAPASTSGPAEAAP